MKSSSTLEWLLEKDQPSIRYQTLTQLLDKPESNPEVKEALSLIPKHGWAASILNKQRPDGYWQTSEGLYRPKYTTSNWQLLVLSDLGVTAADPRVKKTCELFFDQRYRADGGFGGKSKEGVSRSHFCGTGNAARMFVRFGYSEDNRVKTAFDWLVEHQRADDGWHCFPGRYSTLDCWEALAAYATLPREKWTRSIKRSAERGAEFYLSHELWREGRKRYEPWFRFHYPWHYYYDILLGLDILTSLGYEDDPRLKTALNLLREKRRPDGRWVMDAVHPDIDPGATYQEPGAKPLIIEKLGEPSKMMTLIALRVLKRVEGGLSPAGG